MLIHSFGQGSPDIDAINMPVFDFVRKTEPGAKNKNASSFLENLVMAYFLELCSKMKSSTFWANYSMLQSTFAIKHDVDLKLRLLLKWQAKDYRPKQFKILTKEKINKFIQEASDKEYLMIKVALIFGVSGACRMDELVRMTLQDVEDIQSKLVTSILDSKTKKPRSFAVNQMYLNVYRKYVELRPENINSVFFFFQYRNEKDCRR
ncbi:hypothetical protein NQ317_005737 [Molorchus minor]|uniref:Tyr recombinase domain-containing protein n=1 Tax=Molorchus minor TaxID=1323400 RepID=A0ABQ9JDF0_9CUCU|nr:hypothetical protein NQ317_005737 [Molorchus minor]